MDTRVSLAAVLVCVDYSDFLELTLPENKDQFDNIVVVTSPQDKNTQRVAAQNNVTCLITDIFYEKGAVFNKGGGLNLGIKHIIHGCDFLTILDADTIVPKNFRQNSPWEFMHKNILYGGSRRFIWTYKEYQEYKLGYLKEESFELVRGEGCGFCVITSSKSDVYLKYSNYYPNSRTAEQVDIDFLKRFHPEVKGIGFLPELNCIHLGPHGINHALRVNSKIPEGRILFKNMPDLRNNEHYK